MDRFPGGFFAETDCYSGSQMLSGQSLGNLCGWSWFMSADTTKRLAQVALSCPSNMWLSNEIFSTRSRIC